MNHDYKHYRTRPEGDLRRDPMCPVRKSGGGFRTFSASCLWRLNLQLDEKLCRYFYFFFDLGPTQVKCQLLNHDILLNEFLAYFWKYPRAPI